MRDLHIMRCNTVSWLTWKRKSEEYKEKVEKELIEYGKMSALCKWWKGVNHGNKTTRDL